MLSMVSVYLMLGEIISPSKGALICILLSKTVLPPFQIVSRFYFSRFIGIIIYIDILYVYIHNL
jgi:hypothetical protein